MGHSKPLTFHYPVDPSHPSKTTVDHQWSGCGNTMLPPSLYLVSILSSWPTSLESNLHLILWRLALIRDLWIFLFWAKVFLLNSIPDKFCHIILAISREYWFPKPSQQSFPAWPADRFASFYNLFSLRPHLFLYYPHVTPNTFTPLDRLNAICLNIPAWQQTGNPRCSSLWSWTWLYILYHVSGLAQNIAQSYTSSYLPTGRGGQGSSLLRILQSWQW